MISIKRFKELQYFILTDFSLSQIEKLYEVMGNYLELEKEKNKWVLVIVIALIVSRIELLHRVNVLIVVIA